MHFLHTISGLNGEPLTSAVLKYLFINSSVFRDLFLQRIVSMFPPSRLATFSQGIHCSTEVVTDAGRLDLLIEGDNFVIGIENKLWAPAQVGQPGKYRAFLSRRALDRFTDGAAHRIIVLAPQKRDKEIYRLLADQSLENVAFPIWWQQILDDLNHVESEESASLRAVARFLREFVRPIIEGFDSLNIPKEQIVGRQIAINNPYQRDLLYRLCDLVSDPGRVSKGIHHVGFGFSLGQNELAAWQWLGFVEERGDCQLEIHTSILQRSISLPVYVTDVGASYAGGRKLRLMISSDLKTIEEWQRFLTPCIDSIQQALPNTTN